MIGVCVDFGAVRLFSATANAWMIEFPICDDKNRRSFGGLFCFSLFRCSIEENIVYSTFNPCSDMHINGPWLQARGAGADSQRPMQDTDPRIVEAAKVANAHDFISSLPEMYRTEVCAPHNDEPSVLLDTPFWKPWTKRANGVWCFKSDHACNMQPQRYHPSYVGC